MKRGIGGEIIIESRAEQSRAEQSRAEQSRAEQSRVGYIDLFRGIGILLMITGHTNSFGGHFDKFIHAFHVPMFFVISGYLYKTDKYTLSEIIIKRIRTLLVPYFIFGAIHVIRAILTEKTFKVEYLENFLLWSKEGMPVPGTCWLLIVMFIADLMYSLIIKKCKDNRPQIAVVLITGLGLCFQFVDIPILWGLDSAFVAVGLMYLGSLAKKFEKIPWISRLLSLNVLEIAVGGIVVTGVILIAPCINMRTADYGFWPLFFINVVGACAIGISICKKLEYIGSKTKVMCYIKHVGETSIVYLCCNQLLIESIRGYIRIENTYFAGAVLLFVTCAVIEIICFIIYHTKLKVIIGK